MQDSDRRELLVNGARHAAHVLEPILYSIPLSIWANYLSESLEDEDGFWRAVQGLGLRNALVVTTLAVIVGMEIVKARREERLRRAAEADVLKTERSSHRVLMASLHNANGAIRRALGVRCNARYFPVTDVNGEKRLVQARDLHIEDIQMPSEYGFSGVPVDDPAFISARSFQTKAPIFEELPEDHITWYAPDVATMVEARQRWVLACPVLSIDGTTGDLRIDRDPHGVLVFYGVEVPRGRQTDERVRESLGYGQRAAETFSFVLEIGEAVGDLAR